MAEELTLTTPITKPSTLGWTVARLDFNWREAIIHVELLGTNGERLEHDYRGTLATNLMVALNKADLTVKSLHRRVLERLLADVVLDGTISGSPE